MHHHATQPGRVHPSMKATDSSAQRPFRLLQWFSAIGAISIVAVTLLCALFLSRFLSNTVLWHDAQLMTQFLNSIVRVERAQPFFATDGAVGGGRDIERFLHHTSSLPGVLKVNAYGLKRTVIWSSDEELVGRAFGDNHELEEAMSGRPVINFGTSGGEEKREHVFFDEAGIRFVENYLPVWMPGQENSLVIGVIEVYRRPTRLFEALSDSTKLVWTAAGLASLVMCALLFWLAWRTSQAIERQQRELVRAESFANMGEMASVMAHGLRNPLSSIRSSAELGIELDEDKGKNELFTDIVLLSDRVESWVRQYLSYVRPDEDMATSANLNAIVADCLAAFEAQISRHNVDVEHNSADDIPRCDINPIIVSQAINSMLANALEAMQHGGRLSVNTSVDRVSGRVNLSISDNGPGMDAAGQRNAFEPFVTSKSAGMGLGLPLTREALARNGASLTLESKVGQGTTVLISLPVQQ